MCSLFWKSWGGGNASAAGGQIPGEIDDMTRKLLTAIDQYFEEGSLIRGFSPRGTHFNA